MDFHYYIFLHIIEISVTSVQNVGKTQQQTNLIWFCWQCGGSGGDTW